MEQDIGQMMSPRREPVNLAVQHVRKPRQRVPIAGIFGCEGPGYVPGRQTVGNIRIVIHVTIVVIVYKLVVESLTKDYKNGNRQKPQTATTI